MCKSSRPGLQGYKMVARVVKQEGHCIAGHKVGDEVVFQDQTIDGKICIHALYSFLPKVFAMRYGADFEWLDNPDVSFSACPDHDNPVVFENPKNQRITCEQHIIIPFPETTPGMSIEQEARELHKNTVIIDGLQVSKWSGTVFETIRKGGLTAVNSTVAVREGFRETVTAIEGFYRMFEEFSDLILPVETVQDIHTAKKTGRTGIILSFQNTSPIEDDLRLLSIFKKLGVRVIQLTYMKRNYVGDGCLERTDSGLSRFGLETIGEMNRLGILIDLSHVGDKTAMEAVDASEQPVALTHANPRSMCSHPRNKTDELIQAVAQKGGVIGANVFPPFLAKGADSTVEDVVDVIDRLAELAGIDHVAIGTDFTQDQPPEFFRYILSEKTLQGPAMDLKLPIVNPKGIQTAADFPNLTRALLKRGYSEQDTRKIMGENWLNLFEKVWV